MALPSITPAIRAFLDEMTVPCVISTLRPDGAPITSATWFGFLDDDIIVSTPARRNKARFARNDPRISFIVDTKVAPYRGVAIEGTAEVLDDADNALLLRIVERYLGPQDPSALGERFRAVGERVVLRLRPERVRPWGLPGAAGGE
jgi:PPOX class probable F420-dependent enzyme